MLCINLRVRKSSSYIGQSKRELKHRIKEHQQASYANKKTPYIRQKTNKFQQKGIYHLISNCDCYKTNLEHYLK